MRRSFFVLVVLFVIFTVTAPVLGQESEYDTGLKYYYNGKYEEAIKHLRDSVNKKPDPAAYYLIGYSFYKLGKFKEATPYFEEAYFIDPNFSPEKSGLAGEFPKGKPAGVTKKRAHKGKAASHKKKKVAGLGTKQDPAQAPPSVKQPSAETQPKKAGQPEVAAGRTTPRSEAKKPSSGAASGKSATQNQKTVPPADESRNMKPAEPKEPDAGKKAPSGVQQAGPEDKLPPEGNPLPSLTQKDMKTFLPILAIPMVMGGLFAGFALVFLAIGLAFYLFGSLCLFLIAKKLNVQAPWTAWIPLVQLWTVVACAGKPWWWILLFLIPIVNVIVMVYLWMCIAENLGRNKWLGLLWLVPIANLIFIGILAFSKPAVTEVPGVIGGTPEEMAPSDQDEF